MRCLLEVFGDSAVRRRRRPDGIVTCIIDPKPACAASTLSTRQRRFGSSLTALVTYDSRLAREAGMTGAAPA
jgi:hypothetical protein